MTNEELERENKELKERIEFLEKVIKKGNTGNSSAYTMIRLAIVEKVDKEFDTSRFDEWKRNIEVSKLQRQIMRDLKWELRVRQISDFRLDHVEAAKEYIKNYKIENRW